MLNEILTIGICALAASGAVRAPQNLDIMNSTDYLISIYDVDSQTQYDLPDRTENEIPLGYDFTVMVQKDGDETMPKPDLWYFEIYPDNETEVHLATSVWTDSGDYFETFISLNSNTTALQFFEKVSLVDEVFYIVQPNLENTNNGIGNILPEGSSALLELQGDSNISITKLTYSKTRMNTGILGYAFFKINDLTIIANNSVTGVTPNSPSECTQVMMYQGTYTNKITFTSGYYPRMWNTKGYNENIPMLSKEYQPYATFSAAGNVGISLVPMTTGVTLVALSFEALNSLFGYVVFPGLTLGMLLLVPIFLGLLFTIIKLVKKG